MFIRVSKGTAATLLAAATLVCGPVARADDLTRPVLLVIAGDGGALHGPTGDSVRRATVGREGYSDETLETQQAAITFAYCPDLPSQATVYELAPASTVRIRAASLVKTAAVRRIATLATCEIPQVSSTALASTIDDSDSQGAPAGGLEDRIGRLEHDAQQAVRISLANSDHLIQAGTYALVGHATRASILEKAGLLEDAVTELRFIREHWYEATWTRNAITRLNRTIIVRESLSSPGTGVSIEPAEHVFDPGKGKAYALLIGISRFKNPAIPELRFADKDAESFRDYLLSPRGGQLGSDQVQLLLNEKATRDAIETGIANLVRGKGNRDNTLIIFLASHGKLICDQSADLQNPDTCAPTDREPYFFAFNTYENEAKTTAVSATEFRRMITDRVKEFGRVLVFVDACHAGRIASLPASTRLNASNLSSVFENESGMLGLMLGNSAAKKESDELTYELSALAHGIFTYYTLLGLNQEVPASDGKIYFTDLGSYVSQQVVKTTGRKQQPFTFSPEHDLIAVDDASKLGLADIASVKGPIDMMAEPRARDPEVAAAPPEILVIKDAIEQGRLLPAEPGSAYDLVRRLRQVKSGQAEYRAALDGVRVALEEKGQAIILKYLEGDEVAQTEADFQLGERCFRAALDLAPDSSFDESRLLFCRGRAEIFRKDYLAARQTLETAIGLDPLRAYSYNALGIAYLEQATTDFKNIEAAIRNFQTAKKLAPYWAYPRHNLALTYAAAGRFDEAIGEYQQARQLAPSYSYLPYNEGLLYQQISSEPEARIAYLDALATAEKTCSKENSTHCATAARAQTALGVLAQKQGRTKLAESYYVSALRSDPELMDARHDLAVMWSASDKHEKQAEELWLRNLNEDPLHIPSLIGLAGLLRKERRFNESLPIYERLYRLRPTYVPGVVGFADMLTASGSADKAITLLDEHVTAARENPEFWIVRFHTDLVMKNSSAALMDFRQALSLTPRKAERRALKRTFAAWSRAASTPPYDSKL